MEENKLKRKRGQKRRGRVRGCALKGRSIGQISRATLLFRNFRWTRSRKLACRCNLRRRGRLRACQSGAARLASVRGGMVPLRCQPCGWRTRGAAPHLQIASRLATGRPERLQQSFKYLDRAPDTRDHGLEVISAASADRTADSDTDPICFITTANIRYQAFKPNRTIRPTTVQRLRQLTFQRRETSTRPSRDR